MRLVAKGFRNERGAEAVEWLLVVGILTLATVLLLGPSPDTPLYGLLTSAISHIVATWQPPPL